MTDEERARLTAAKADVTARLAGVDLGALRLGAVDARLKSYVYAVARDGSAHNIWEQLAVERFIGLAGRYGIDKRRVQRFFTFYEHLKFPGTRGMQCYKLTPVQCFQFASIFGFWEGGRRVQHLGGYLYNVTAVLPLRRIGMQTLKCNRVNT